MIIDMHLIAYMLHSCYFITILKVLMRVEQEQRVTEDARIYAEQDAAAQRYAAQVLQVYILNTTLILNKTNLDFIRLYELLPFFVLCIPSPYLLI